MPEIAAFCRLADDSRPYLKAVVARVLHGRLASKLDASDVVQEGLALALGRLEQCRGQTPEEQRAWLVAIVRNHAHNVLRYWNRQERDVQRERRLPADPQHGPPLASGGSSPSQRASRREQAARLAAAVEQLPPDHRQIIHLREFEGLSHTEAAQRMGRSPEAIRKLWVRALQLLRARLGDTL